jgi:hypothetical protein
MYIFKMFFHTLWCAILLSISILCSIRGFKHDSLQGNRVRLRTGTRIIITPITYCEKRLHKGYGDAKCLHSLYFKSNVLFKIMMMWNLWNRIFRDLPLKIDFHCNGLKKLKPRQVSGLHDGFCNLLSMMYIKCITNFFEKIQQKKVTSFNRFLLPRKHQRHVISRN